MDFRVRSVINREHPAESKARLQISDGFKVGAKAEASQQTVLAGLDLV